MLLCLAKLRERHQTQPLLHLSHSAGTCSRACIWRELPAAQRALRSLGVCLPLVKPVRPAPWALMPDRSLYLQSERNVFREMFHESSTEA